MERADHTDRWLALIPAVVLAVFAMSHLWRSQSYPVSSWREGGMGMYSDINDLRGRVMRIYVQREQWEPAKVSERYEARLNRARLEPTREKLIALVAFLSCDRLFLSQNLTASHIRVDYLEQQFDPTTYTVRLKERLKETHAICR
jgi:hypothetical protein